MVSGDSEMAKRLMGVTSLLLVCSIELSIGKPPIIFQHFSLVPIVKYFMHLKIVFHQIHNPMTTAIISSHT